MTDAVPESARERETPAFMPQLDGLRAIAVLLVLNHHFMSPAWKFGGRVYVDRLGPMGVRLFFVLSGFLITGILLKCRAETGQSMGVTLRQFYARRFLRIFPLYYLVLGVAAVMALPDVRESFWWHAGYVSNVYYTWKETWGIGPCSHFWSLAVEEQFYLAWPLLILAVPRRGLYPVVIGAMCLAPAFRLAGYAMGWPEVAMYYLPPACLDALGGGALLALAASPAYGSTSRRLWLERVGLWGGLPAVVVLYGATFGGWVGRWWVPISFVDTAAALLFVWLISRAARGFGGPVGVVLGRGPLGFVGRISYGIYVYHFFVFWMLISTMRGIEAYAWGVALTVLVASVSYYGFERPINELKRYFPYRVAERRRRVDPGERAGVGVTLAVGAAASAEE